MTSPESEGARRKSLSGHFRIWEDVFSSLEDEARRKNVSLNTLVNQVLSAHTRDEVLFEELGFLKMSKDVYRTYLSLIPDDKLVELGKMNVKGEDTIMLARKGAVTLDAVLDYLRLLSRFGWFSLNETKRNGKEIISLIHDFGPRESVVLGAFVTSLFALAGVRPKVTTTNSSVMVEY